MGAEGRVARLFDDPGVYVTVREQWSPRDGGRLLLLAPRRDGRRRPVRLGVGLPELVPGFSASSLSLAVLFSIGPPGLLNGRQAPHGLPSSCGTVPTTP